MGLNIQAQTPELNFKAQLTFLADDALEGRETGSQGAAIAAGYIAAEFQHLGLKAIAEQGYFQEFSFHPRLNPHSTKADTSKPAVLARNVLGLIDHGAEQTVVIGAHYDHLGHGGEGSLHAANDGQIHNGADDNASGVALLLYLAKELKKSNYAGSNYLLIAFSGEEKGLLGSNYYAKHPSQSLENVKYMLNFDMVGRLSDAKGLAINGVGTAEEWKDLIESANMEALKISTTESGIGPSDHTSFYLQDLPVLHFFTGGHEDYHKPSDDADKISYQGMQQIADLVCQLIKQTDGTKALSFQKTKEKESPTPRFTVTLGVMPDYLFDGEGMRIDGIIEDRPAQKANLEKGDVVIQLGTHKVIGMQSYMEALSKFKKGEKTTVRVKRGDEEVEAELQF